MTRAPPPEFRVCQSLIIRLLSPHTGFAPLLRAVKLLLNFYYIVNQFI